MYRSKTRQAYRSREPHLKSSMFTSPSPSRMVERAVRANIVDLTLFLLKYLSGKSDINVTPIQDAGYSCARKKVGSRTIYEITVPDWQTYDLPLPDKDKYRIYRSSVWHEACHARYTPDSVFRYGVSGNRDFNSTLVRF